MDNEKKWWIGNGDEDPLDESQITAVMKFQNKMADELMAWAEDTRAAWKEHNQNLRQRPDGTWPKERRPDLRSCADGIEMAAHAVRRGRVPEDVGWRQELRKRQQRKEEK